MAIGKEISLATTQMYFYCQLTCDSPEKRPKHTLQNVMEASHIHRHKYEKDLVEKKQINVEHIIQ